MGHVGDGEPGARSRRETARLPASSVRRRRSSEVGPWPPGARTVHAAGHNGGVTFLAGRLLVATPSTGGEIFDRAVVLLLHHDEDGAHGLVLNKPIAAEVEAVLPEWQPHVVAPGTIFQGGPVGLDTALGLVRLHDVTAGDDLGIKRLFDGIGVIDLDAPPELIVPHVLAVRVFAGYSGWSAGQLEGEIEAGAWCLVDARPGDAFVPVPEMLWRMVLRRAGGQAAWLSTFPEDPRLN